MTHLERDIARLYFFDMLEQFGLVLCRQPPQGSVELDHDDELPDLALDFEHVGILDLKLLLDLSDEFPPMQLKQFDLVILQVNLFFP